MSSATYNDSKENAKLNVETFKDQLSDEIILRYGDNQSDNVSDAMKEGRVTFQDLCDYHFET